MNRRVRVGAEIRGLVGHRRLSSGVLTLVSGATATPGPPLLAFAVPRSVGCAVVRNRVRRRLRAASRVHAALVAPGRVYLIGVRTSVTNSTYREIEVTLGELLERSAEGRP